MILLYLHPLKEEKLKILYAIENIVRNVLLDLFMEKVVDHLEIFVEVFIIKKLLRKTF